jgi:hypothetical protein
MSTPSVTSPPVSLRTLLLGQPDDGEATEALSQAIGEKELARAALGGARNLSTATVRTVDHEIGAVTSRLLSMDLGDVLVAGWRRYQVLTDAARRTSDSPDVEEVLPLVSHRVTCTYSPSVDLLVDEMRVHTFEFKLIVTFDLTGLSAVVAGGSLVALSGGDCQATGVLSLDGTALVQRQRSFEPRFIVRLDRPIRLVQPSEPKPPQQRTTSAGGSPVTSRTPR